MCLGFEIQFASGPSHAFSSVTGDNNHTPRKHAALKPIISRKGDILIFV